MELGVAEVESSTPEAMAASVPNERVDGPSATTERERQWDSGRFAPTLCFFATRHAPLHATGHYKGALTFTHTERGYTPVLPHCPPDATRPPGHTRRFDSHAIGPGRQRRNGGFWLGQQSRASRGKRKDAFALGDDAVVPSRPQAALANGVDAAYPVLSLRRACPIALGRGAPRGHAPSVLDASVTRQVQDGLPVLLERLPAQNLREQVGGIRVARDVAHDHLARTTQLAHLEHLTVDVTRVLRGGEAVAEVIRRLAIGADFDSIRSIMAEEVDHGDRMQQLDRTIGQRDELGLTR